MRRREKEEEAVNYAHAYDDDGRRGGLWGGMIVLFEMSLAHDCTTFLFDAAAARPAPRSLSFQGELRSPCLCRLAFVQPWQAAVVRVVHRSLQQSLTTDC